MTPSVQPKRHLSAVLAVLLSAAVWGSAVRPAVASPGPADAAIDSLQQENPSFSKLAERDPGLIELLRGDPELAARLADKPTLTERVIEALTNPWVLFGFGAQFMFMMRFLVQWIASERKKRSHVPVVFWYFSMGGGLMLLTYAIQRRDPVFILGQALGLLIYTRNLILIYRRAREARELRADRAEKLAELSASAVISAD